MKYIKYKIIAISLFLFNSIYANETPITHNGVSGSFEYSIAGYEQYSITISTGTSQKVLVNIEYDVAETSSLAVFESLPSYNSVIGYSGTGKASILTKNKSGEVYIEFWAMDSEFSDYGGSINVSWKAVDDATVYEFNGSTLIKSSSTAPNLLIDDSYNRELCSYNAITPKYNNAHLLLRNSNGFQLGLGANSICSSTTLGYTSYSHCFNTTKYSSALTISNNGNVSIGYGQAPYKLSVAGDVMSTGDVLLSASRLSRSIYYKTSSGTQLSRIWTDASTPSLYLSSGDATPDIAIDAAGKVGIGTITPTAQLELADIYSAGGKNLLIGDDVYLSDVDIANTLGVYSNSNSAIGNLKLGSNGPILFGQNQRLGIGVSPEAGLHVSSTAVPLSSVEQFNANLLIQASSTTRAITEGAALGFVVPANTDGSNPWQQGRILVAPNNTNGGNAEGKMYIQTRSWGNNNWIWQNNLVLKPNSYVGINTDDPKYQLDVKGTIRAEEVKVEIVSASQMNVEGDVYANKVKVATNGQTADFVFEDGYELKDLAEVEIYIKEHKHLPNIPSATEMEASGVDLAEMNKLLLQKIEELTLYNINLEKARHQEKTEREALEERLKKLETLVINK